MAGFLPAKGMGLGEKAASPDVLVEEARCRARAWKEKRMTLDRAVLMFAGCVVLLSVALALMVSPWWSALTVFVGFNLIQASFTGFCPAAMLFRKLGVKPGVAFK